MDNDGVPDFLVSSPSAGHGQVHLVSGATRTVRTIANPGTGNWATAILISTGDMDQDGVPDVVLDANGNLAAYSGATRTLIWQTAGLDIRKAVDVGDLDSDGRSDLAVVVFNNGNEYLWTLRGSNGTQLAAMANQLNGNVQSFVNLGDVDGDGRSEVAYGNSNSIWIYHASPPSLMRTIQTQQCRRMLAANVAGDGRNELLVTDSAIVQAFSATTGSLVRSYGNVFDGHFAVIGDLDGDGVPDLALRVGTGSVGDGVDLVSGATAVRIGRWLGTARLDCLELAGVGDVNADGFGDLLIGDENASVNGNAGPATGGWQLVSGRLLASVLSIPVQCAQGPWFPQLGMTRPIIGQSVTVEGRDAPAAPGTLALSLQPALPTNMGAVGCDAWFDVRNWVILNQTTTPAWTLQVPLPNAPQLAGFALALQAFYVPTASPIGYDLTNALWARLGY
jgi:hypothetical protein